MGDPDKAALKPENLRKQARKLVEDAAAFRDGFDGLQAGLRNAASDKEPWFSAGGWGMFKQPAKAAFEGDRFVTQIDEVVTELGDDFRRMVDDLAGVDVENGTALDEVSKAVFLR